MTPLRLTLVVACSLSLASAAARLDGADEPPTGLTTEAPVINFRVPTFTKQGYRSWLLRGTEGLYVNQNQIQVTDLNLTVFTGDASNQVESVFLSPTATALMNESVVQSPGPLRLVRTDLEATGEDWIYNHREKKVSIRKDVHVIFHAQLKDILR